MNHIQIAKENDLLSSEKEMIYTVLNKYDFKVLRILKSRSAYKIECEGENICLKRMRHGRYKARNGTILVDGLLKNGFTNIARYILTKNGECVVRYKKFIFYATEWIDGEECNLGNIDEVKNCVKLLAEFHLVSSKIQVEKLNIKNNLKNWPKIFTANLNDLEFYKKIILRKRLRNEFDSAYLSCIDSFYDRGIAILGMLNNSEYYKVSKEANEKKTICHDSFYYQNVIKRKNKYYIIDLDSIMIDLQVNDLGKLIRRLMYKSNYQWNFEIAKQCIDAYNEINPLSKSELEIMLALIIFPHKFWKLGKKRYVKHKNWTEAKYTHKLNKLVKYDEAQQKFFEQYVQYINVAVVEEAI